MDFANQSIGHSLLHVFLTCQGYSWLMYWSGGKLLLPVINWSLSSLFWNVTEIGQL